MLITHTMDVIRTVADRVAVLNHGQIVESGDLIDVFLHARHAVTKALLPKAASTPAALRTRREAPGRCWRLDVFRAPPARQPLLTRLSRELDLNFSILQASVGRLKDTPYGQLTLELERHDGAPFAAAARGIDGARHTLRGGAVIMDALHSAWAAVLDFEYWPEIGSGTLDTLVMSGLSLLFTVLIGLPIGTLLFLTGWAHRSPRPGVAAVQAWAYGALSFAVNVLRSIPFLILLIFAHPGDALDRRHFARRSGVHTAAGHRGGAVLRPLGRERAARSRRPVSSRRGRAMGATTRQTVLWALLPEAFSALLAAITVTAIALVGYSAMSGVIGGGGLGDLAVRYGYQRFNTPVMVVTVAIQVLLVQTHTMGGRSLRNLFESSIDRESVLHRNHLC